MVSERSSIPSTSSGSFSQLDRTRDDSVSPSINDLRPAKKGRQSGAQDVDGAQEYRRGRGHMAEAGRQTLRLDSLGQLELRYVLAEMVTYRGRRAVRLVESDENPADDQAVAVISGSEFKDGTIEIDVVGIPRPDAPDYARGFVGVAFRLHSAARHFECFFLRPTNSRAEDQLRRNHSTQYMSQPDYPWFRLRDESPGVYESYADLEPGAWTSVKIVVSGIQASLHVNAAAHPCLVVNDLKLGDSHGQIALWIGGGTEAYFSTRIDVAHSTRAA